MLRNLSDIIKLVSAEAEVKPKFLEINNDFAMILKTCDKNMSEEL